MEHNTNPKPNISTHKTPPSNLIFDQISKNTKTKRPTFILIVVGLLLIAGAAFLGYRYGYNRGKDDGIASTKTNVPNLLENIPNIFNSVSGTVQEVTDSSITVKTDSETKTFDLTENIKVNKGDQELSISDVKKENEVIMYSAKKDGKLMPTRIVIK